MPPSSRRTVGAIVTTARASNAPANATSVSPRVERRSAGCQMLASCGVETGDGMRGLAGFASLTQFAPDARAKRMTDDRELVEAFRAGELGAGTALVERHFD